MFFTLLSIPPSQEYFIIVIGFLLWKYYELQQSVLYQAITLYSYPVVFVIKNIFSTTTHHKANVYCNKCVYVLICSVTKILKINCCFSICCRVIFSMAKCIDSISSILWDTYYNLLHRLRFLFHSITLYDTFDLQLNLCIWFPSDWREILNDIKENVLHDNKLFVSKCNGLKYKNSKECDPFMLQVYKEIIYYTPSFSALLLLVMVMWLLNRVDRNTLFQRKLWNWLQCTLTHFDALW